jgi:hypothetical protein
MGTAVTLLALAPGFIPVFLIYLLFFNLTIWYLPGMVLVYVGLGYHVGRRAAAALPPRWQVALRLGWWAARDQVLAIVVATALPALPVAFLYGLVISPGAWFNPRAAGEVLVAVAAFQGISAGLGLTIGTLFAWLGAGLALRRHAPPQAWASPQSPPV